MAETGRNGRPHVYMDIEHARRKRMLQKARTWARTLKRDVVALWLAARDPRVPLSAKIVAGAVAAYALSPVDLIPDFIPILGYLDDLLIVPIGIVLAIRLVPDDLMTEFRGKAEQRSERPVSKAGLAFILAIWLACIIFVTWSVRDMI
jgi:uncharacterized membrane protein YkvA (DUF1232 family)